MKQKLSKSHRNIFRKYLASKTINIQNYKLPSLINKEINNKRKNQALNISLSNGNTNNTNLKLSSKLPSFTESNKWNSKTIETQFDSSNISGETKKTYKVQLEKDKEKINKIINYFKELDNSNPNTLNDVKNSNIINNNIYNKEISSAFTKCYQITKHQQKFDVIKLNNWDEENLKSFYGNTNIIYHYLFNYHKSKNNKNKLDEIKYYKRIIDNNGNFVDNIIKSNHGNNKIIQSLKDQKNLEEGSILHNMISKTHYRFKHDLIMKDKKISLNFGLDNDAFDAMKKEKDLSTFYYGKVIKEKEKQESTKREELMNLSIKILNKKKEKNKIEKNIGKNFEQTNNTIKKYNLIIAKIKEEIHDKKEHYQKVQNIEVEDFQEEHKKIQLKQIKESREKLKLELIKVKYEFKCELKKLDKKKQEILENLDISKNELLFMKIAQIYLTKEIRNYYLDILNKGYDIRNEGLVWVVKRLLEIQTKLDYHHFPKYLDKEQADYIIELANINLEEAQLKIVIDVLQKKQISMHNNYNKKMIQKILVLSKKRKTKSYEENKIKSHSSKKLNEFGKDEKLFNIMHDIYKKYESAFRINNIKRFDDVKEKRITEELKLSLLEGGMNGPHDNLDEINGLLEILDKNGTNKDYFEFILKLKLRMKYLSRKKEQLRQNQMYLFRESLENENRYNYAESSLKYDLVLGALFGNRHIF